MFKEFKKFALRGNVLDLAIGVIVGAAFGKIVSSFVNDIMMPVLNPLIPNGDWKTIQVGPGIKLGSFMGTIIDFIIVAFVVFLIVKAVNKFNKKEEVKQEEIAPSNEEKLLAEIRDLLKQK